MLWTNIHQITENWILPLVVLFAMLVYAVLAIYFYNKDGWFRLSIMQGSVAPWRAGREGGRLLPLSLPATDTPFLHKENKICRFCDYKFPFTTLEGPGCGCLVSQDAPWSARLPEERGASGLVLLIFPALPYISSWLLKMRGNALNEGRNIVN